MRSFSDELKVGILLILSCLVGLVALAYFHVTPGNPFVAFPAKIVAGTLFIALIPTAQLLRRTMQGADYGRPVDPGTGPGVKTKPRS